MAVDNRRYFDYFNANNMFRNPNANNPGPWRSGQGYQTVGQSPVFNGFRPDITTDFDPTGSMGMDMSQINPMSMPNTTMGGTAPTTTPKTGGVSDLGKFGIAGGASALGGIYSYFAADKQLQDLKRRGVPDLVPAALKESLGEQKLRAASAKTSNDAFQRSEINRAENRAINNARVAATSPDQIQSAAVKAQEASNRAKLQLGAMGEQSQSQNRNQLNSLRTQQSQYQKMAQDYYNQGVTSLYNAKQQAIGNTINGIASASLLAL